MHSSPLLSRRSLTLEINSHLFEGVIFLSHLFQEIIKPCILGVRSDSDSDLDSPRNLLSPVQLFWEGQALSAVLLPPSAVWNLSSTQ